VVPEKTEASWNVTKGSCVLLYESVVRPVLEYASPVWHTSVTADQAKTLEAVQQRACQIITGGRTYTENCGLLRLLSPQPAAGEA